MIERTYKCDLCHQLKDPGDVIGLVECAGRWAETHGHESFKQAEVHLCFLCLSTIQSFPKRCIAGFKCNGGATCTSDHN